MVFMENQKVSAEGIFSQTALQNQRFYEAHKIKDFAWVSQKVLVGCPTSEKKEYCLEKFVEGLKGLTYKNFDVCLEDNSKGKEYYKKLLGIAQQWNKEKFPSKFEVIYSGLTSEKARKRVVNGRNKLRKKLLGEGYDYFFSLEQDVVAPANAIEKLLSDDKKIVSAVYLNLMQDKRVNVVAYRFDSEEHKRKGLISPLGLLNILPSQVMEVAATGVGAMLIHRSVLEKISFRYEPKEKAYDDIYFARDARNAGYKIFLDSSLFCQHYFKPSFTKYD
ncbi:MAG: hypothetical protein QT03_C0001G0013 [archaeon GW2011_AR10]|nr:MAG: hypothetical protein QT03_C0001G0013 [archaeon GW2011_AR10]